MSDGTNQKDLVLQPNEYAFVSDRTKGNISCFVGPFKTSLSNTDSPVRFDPKSKRFIDTSLEDAKQLFLVAPENWYITLKNPTEDGQYPIEGKSNDLKKLKVGKKINIPGPISFSLYPGQIAKIIEGHHLKSNQYLLVRVYDVEEAKNNWTHGKHATRASTQAVTSLDNKDQKDPNLTEQIEQNSVGTLDLSDTSFIDNIGLGDLFIIKGTDVSFYIPPTGVEVVPNGKDSSGKTIYVREAISLERLEYCILRGEDGNKRYVIGPAVVFPNPTESFLTDSSGSNKYKAVELSENSGIYVKVIADYTEDNIQHLTGDEIFITGKDQMIYYPRAEHSIIKYGDKIIHHAIAIPEGEGRYILNRNTGEVKIVKGPDMFLPDPRTEVVVNRILTQQQCALWYPGNTRVALHNLNLEKAAEERVNSGSIHENMLYNAKTKSGSPRSLSKSIDVDSMPTMSFMAQTSTQYVSPEALQGLAENPDSISRSTEYTKPRTITLNTDLDGVVSINVWTGYAINVINKRGDRKVIKGPITYMLEYDENLETLQLSTGKPKNTDNMYSTVYLRVKNNKVSDIADVETSDFCKVLIKLSYSLNFEEDSNSWFNVDNYIKYLCDRMRSMLKNEAKKHNLEYFYSNAHEIVRKIILDKRAAVVQLEDGGEDCETPERKYSGRFFSENGMHVFDVDVLSVNINDRAIENTLIEHQTSVISKQLEVSREQQNYKLEHDLSEIQKKNYELAAQMTILRLELNATAEKARIGKEMELDAAKNSLVMASEIARHKNAIDKLNNQTAEEEKESDLFNLTMTKKKEEFDEWLREEKEKINLDCVTIEKETEGIVDRFKAISPALISVLTDASNKQTLRTITEAMAPLAIAENSSIADVLNKLLRGTSMEELVSNLGSIQINGNSND